MEKWSKEKGLKFFKEKLQAFKTAMLTTYTKGKGFHSRPMGTAELDEEGNMWFFTNESAFREKQAAIGNRVSLTYTDTQEEPFLSVVGRASLVDDRPRLQRLWNPFAKAFFPKGQDDPNLTLLRVKPTHIEYWDDASSNMDILFDTLKRHGNR